MALPSIGPISFLDIQTQFGGSNPISMNEYYSNGANVDKFVEGDLGFIPESGALGVNRFLGSPKTLASGALWRARPRDTAKNIQLPYLMNSSCLIEGASSGTTAGSPVPLEVSYTSGTTWLSKMTSLVLDSTVASYGIDALGKDGEDLYYCVQWPSLNKYYIYKTTNGIDFTLVGNGTGTPYTLSGSQRYSQVTLVSAGVYYGQKRILFYFSADLAYQSIKIYTPETNSWTSGATSYQRADVVFCPNTTFSATGGLFISSLANGGSVNTIFTSPDGLTWTTRYVYDTLGSLKSYTGLYISETINRVYAGACYFNNRYFLFTIPASTTDLGYITSSNGIDFTYMGKISNASVGATSFAVAVGSTSLAVLMVRTGLPPLLFLTYDGVSWLDLPAPGLPSGRTLQLMYQSGYYHAIVSDVALPSSEANHFVIAE